MSSQPRPGTWGQSARYPAGHPGEPLWARVALPLVALTGAGTCVIDLAALLSSLLSGHGIPALAGGWLLGPLALITHPADPGAAWRSRAAAPPAALLWVILGLLLVATVICVLLALSWWERRREAGEQRNPLRKRHGFLPLHQALAAYGEAAARRRAARLHPSLTPEELRQRPIAQLAIPLGSSGGQAMYASHEEAVGILGGMRQGKTSAQARIALPHVGPVAFTTTKPADLEYVWQPPGAPGRPILFNPEALSGLPSAAYDPTLGCEDPTPPASPPRR